jgi:hypothetical protein
MKKYIEVEIELVVLQAQDIVTLSGFNGGEHGFDNPNGGGNFSEND